MNKFIKHTSLLTATVAIAAVFSNKFQSNFTDDNFTNINTHFVNVDNELVVDDCFIDGNEYVNTKHPYNVKLHGKLNEGKPLVMDYNKITGSNEEKISKGVKWFDDDDVVSNGNETEYSPIATFYFAPNIEHLENFNISFEVEDHYRRTGTWGDDNAETGSIKTVNLTTLSQNPDSKELTTSSGKAVYEDHVYTCCPKGDD